MNPILHKRQPDDQVFAALSTGPRRALLNALPATRAELEGLLPDLSHEAVGRHLNALVGAGLAVRTHVGGAHRVRYRRDNGSLARALGRIAWARRR